MSHRRRRNVLFGAILLALAVATAPAGAGKAQPKPTTFEAEGCTEAMAFFLRDLETLRPFVPERFTPDEVFPGVGELLVMITRCDAGTLNGKRVGPTIFSEVGIYIEQPEEAERLPPEATVGWQYYQPWHLTDLRPLRRALDKLGVDGAVIADATFASPSPVQTEGEMPWDRVPYALTAVHPARTGLFSSRPSTFWHVGSKGLVATIYTVEERTYQAGITHFRTSPGTPLAEMVGGASAIADQGVIGMYGKLRAEAAIVPR